MTKRDEDIPGRAMELVEMAVTGKLNPPGQPTLHLGAGTLNSQTAPFTMEGRT